MPDSPPSLRLILTGTGGRLGAALARELRQRHRVVAYDRKALNLAIPAHIDDHFRPLAFDAVINCAALTSLDYCEQHPAEAHAVNAAAPAHLAALCAERRARFIHLSTDYVYDGSSPGLRRESDPCLPLSIYALTKRDAEQAVLAAHPDFLVARASWIYGPDRPSFPDAIIQRAQNASHGLAIADKWSSPSYSRDLALQLEALLLNPNARGLVNLCNAGSCSWLEYGQAALDLAHHAGVPLRCRTLSPQTCAEMPGFLAQRPRHTAMDSSRLAALTGLTPRPWRDALADYINTYYGRA